MKGTPEWLAATDNTWHGHYRVTVRADFRLGPDDLINALCWYRAVLGQSRETDEPPILYRRQALAVIRAQVHEHGLRHLHEWENRVPSAESVREYRIWATRLVRTHFGHHFPSWKAPA